MREEDRPVTVDEVRAFALALPEATEEPHFDMASFRIRGKIFCTVPPGDDRIHVFVAEDEIRALAAADPTVFEEVWWGKKLSGLRIHLQTADPPQVHELLEDSWRRRAPKRVIAAYDDPGKD